MTTGLIKVHVKIAPRKEPLKHPYKLSKKAGRFTEKERSLLETAITTFGEVADWNLIASQIPGRTASQCRKRWNYGRSHHIQRQDEPWTLISEFATGKTPVQCRKQWEERLDSRVNMGQWTNREMDRLMEHMEMQMSRKEEEAKARMSMLIAQRGTDGTNMEDGANHFENILEGGLGGSGQGNGRKCATSLVYTLYTPRQLKRTQYAKKRKDGLYEKERAKAVQCLQMEVVPQHPQQQLHHRQLSFNRSCINSSTGEKGYIRATRQDPEEVQEPRRRHNQQLHENQPHKTRLHEQQRRYDSSIEDGQTSSVEKAKIDSVNAAAPAAITSVP
ncbi:MAG: hypothetical protein J3Q66DRAFT_400064 [Benniella sp.]|nr:MAG: hypothetical protein J3Q66DRAFT_400064 [Benniella sp.]